MTRAFIDFVAQHEDEDTARLLLSAARYPSVDMPAAVQQIEGRRTAREKWPSLLFCDDYEYPPRLNREQASSEEAASYKAIVACGLCVGTSHIAVADLTGGMGIDSLAFAQCRHMADIVRRQSMSHVDYVERSAALCGLMENNCRALGLGNVAVHCADSMEWLAGCGRHFDILFIDPARRSATGRKVVAFEDCEPNIVQYIGLLRSHCSWLIVKASPMIDIDRACMQLGDVAEVHVVAVRGECKEVLFVCGDVAATEPVIHCVDVASQRGGQPVSSMMDFVFTRSAEASCQPRYADGVCSYIYIPDSALMKAGPYNLIASRFGLVKLARNTHLYTGDERVGDFPGRVLRVLGEVKVNRKAVAAVVPDGKAHVVVRNYPVDAAALQRRLGLVEGGDIYVVATTIGTRHTAFVGVPTAAGGR